MLEASDVLCCGLVVERLYHHLIPISPVEITPFIQLNIIDGMGW